jgi:hypothetical protein
MRVERSWRPPNRAPSQTDWSPRRSGCAPGGGGGERNAHGRRLWGGLRNCSHPGAAERSGPSAVWFLAGESRSSRPRRMPRGTAQPEGQSPDPILAEGRTDFPGAKRTGLVERGTDSPGGKKTGLAEVDTDSPGGKRPGLVQRGTDPPGNRGTGIVGGGTDSPRAMRPGPLGKRTGPPGFQGTGSGRRKVAPAAGMKPRSVEGG